MLAASANHILLLSRKVLERPWVIAELCAARKHGTNICVVLVEYPGRQEDPKAFRFPQDLEHAILDWKYRGCIRTATAVLDRFGSECC